MQPHRAVRRCQPFREPIDQRVGASRAEQFGQRDPVFAKRRDRGADAAMRCKAQQRLDPGRARHADPHRRIDPVRAQVFEPGDERVGIEPELRDDQRRHAARGNVVALGLEHGMARRRIHRWMPFGMPGNADRGDTVAFEQPGLEQRHRIGERADGGWRIPGDEEHAADARFGDGPFDGRGEFVERRDATRRQMRHRFESERAHFDGSRDPRVDCLAGEEGDCDGRIERDAVRRLAQRGAILGGHLERIAVGHSGRRPRPGGMDGGDGRHSSSPVGRDCASHRGKLA